MTLKSIITVTSQSLPMVLKYQDREYIIRLTANDNLQMTKNLDKLKNNEYNTDIKAKASTAMGESD